MTAKFPPDVAAVLLEAGWSEGRRAESQTSYAVERVGRWVGRDDTRLEAFPAAIDALAEFGGLFVIQDGPGRDVRRRPFALDPTLVAASGEAVADLARLLGIRLFPLGMEGDNDAILAIDEAGRVFALDHVGEWFLGATVDAALTTLVTGSLPPRLDDEGRW